MRKLRAGALVAVSGVVVGLFGIVPAHATAGPVPTASEILSVTDQYPKAEAFEFDASGQWVDDFNSLSTEISEQFADDFAASEMDFSTLSGWIGFRSRVPAGVAERIAVLDGVEVRESLGYSEIEMAEAIAAMAYEAGEAGPEHGTAAAYQVGNEPEIRVVVEDGATGEVGEAGARASADGEALRSAVATELATDAPSLIQDLDFEISVEVAEGSLVSLEAHSAGGKINGTDRRTCTASFPVKKNGASALGLMTAGHCPGMGKYNTTPNAFYSPYPYSQSTTFDSSTGGDFRWLHSKAMLNGRTYVGTSTGRVFAKAAKWSVGSPLCKYGRTTGRNCDHTVSFSALSYSPYIREAGERRLIGPLRGVIPHITDGGDSGGPWYWNETAIGVHSGVVNGHSVYSNLTYGLLATGTSLFTG